MNNRYALDYSALDSGWATQGAADYCQANGHARYTRDGVDQGYCPRCLETTAPVSVPTWESVTAHSPACVTGAIRMAFQNGAISLGQAMEWVAMWDNDGGLTNYGACTCDRPAPVSEFTDADLISPEAFEPAPVFADLRHDSECECGGTSCADRGQSITITPGAVFDTPFETGCIARTAPDETGSFDAHDSDGVICSFGVSMVIYVHPPVTPFVYSSDAERIAAKGGFGGRTPVGYGDPSPLVPDDRPNYDEESGY